MILLYWMVSTEIEFLVTPGISSTTLHLSCSWGGSYQMLITYISSFSDSNPFFFAILFSGRFPPPLSLFGDGACTGNLWQVKEVQSLRVWCSYYEEMVHNINDGPRRKQCFLSVVWRSGTLSQNGCLRAMEVPEIWKRLTQSTLKV